MKKWMVVLMVLIGMRGYADSWTQKADFPNSKVGPFSFSIGTKGYTGGGIDATSHLTNSFWEYNQLTNAWTQKADMGGPARYYPAGFSIGNKGYAGLGMDQNATNLNDFWEYDTSVNTWIQKTNFPGLGCMYPVSFAIGQYGYVSCGWGSPNYYQDLWRYDPSSNIWLQKTSLSGTGRFGANVFTIGNNAYIGGGNGGVPLNDFWEYNSLTDSWTQKANTPGHPRQDASSFSIGNKGYFGNGDTIGMGYLNDFWEYDANLNLWTQKVNVPGIGRDEAMFFTIGNKGYIGLGSGGNDLWEYSPDSATGINEIHNLISISLYPNPFSTTATLVINGVETQCIASLQIINLLGQEVKTIPIINQKEIPIKVGINRDNLPTGMYFYKIITNKNETVAVGKMVVE